MNWRRGLFRMWLLLSSLWLATCAAIVIIDARLFEPTKTYEIGGRSKERYEITAPAYVTEAQVVAFAKQNERSDCTSSTGPWCSYPLKLQMPGRPVEWALIYVGVGVPAVLLLIGSGFYWAFAGFKPRS